MIWISSLGVSAQRAIRLEAPTDVAEARRQGIDIAAKIGLDEPRAAQLALAVTEAGSNIVKHARAGTILLRALGAEDGPAMEVLALDNGPGIPDVAASMRDGYSTAGTPGNGLGALSRMTQGLEIYSRAGRGTALRFVVRKCKSVSSRNDGLDIGAVCIAKPGENACGDAWSVSQTEDGRVVLIVVDGLGHGPEAASAAHAALEALRRNLSGGATSIDILSSVHRDLHGTRGAAGAVASFTLADRRGSFCGIGNVSCATRTRDATRQLISYNGILGHQTRTMREIEFEFPPDATLIAHSDGLNTHWRLEEYPGLERHHPALVAGVLYRDHCRGRDDATCVALRRVPLERL